MIYKTKQNTEELRGRGNLLHGILRVAANKNLVAFFKRRETTVSDWHTRSSSV